LLYIQIVAYNKPKEHNIQSVPHNRAKITTKHKITVVYQQNNNTSSLQQMHKMTADAQIHGFQTRSLLAFSLFLIGWPAPDGHDFCVPVVGWPCGPDCDEPDYGGATGGPNCGRTPTRLDCDEANSGRAIAGSKCDRVVCGGPDCDEAPVGPNCDSICYGRIGQ